MALQGTIETFALPDVLRLLASTKKSGELRLTGDRGSGSVSVASGEIVKSEASGAPHAQGPVDVLFEMLRFADGEFVFDEGEPADGGTATEVESTLVDAEKLLEEWREIESVVPSGSAWVALVDSLSSDEVTIDKETWKAVVAVGSGATVDQLGAKLELGELPVARLVKDLTERSLVDIGDAPVGAATAAPVAEPTPGPAPAPAPDTAAAPAPAPAPAAAPSDRFDPNALVIEEPAPGTAAAAAPAEAPPAEPAPAPVAEAPIGTDAMAEASPGEAAEIARQLANLSPKAARAVAAAAKATTEEERNAALAEVEEGDDQINRDLLLKFLGTVN